MYFLTLLWLPPAEDASRTESWLYEGRSGAGIDARDWLDSFVDRSDRILQLIEGFVPEVNWLDDAETWKNKYWECAAWREAELRTTSNGARPVKFLFVTDSLDYKLAAAEHFGDKLLTTDTVPKSSSREDGSIQ